MPAVVSEQRQIELQQRKEIYQWDHLSPDLPGNIKAATHADLPRNVQFTDEKSRYLSNEAMLRQVCTCVESK